MAHCVGGTANKQQETKSRRPIATRLIGICRLARPPNPLPTRSNSRSRRAGPSHPFVPLAAAGCTEKVWQVGHFRLNRLPRHQQMTSGAWLPSARSIDRIRRNVACHRFAFCRPVPLKWKRKEKSRQTWSTAQLATKRVAAAISRTQFAVLRDARHSHEKKPFGQQIGPHWLTCIIDGHTLPRPNRTLSMRLYLHAPFCILFLFHHINSINGKAFWFKETTKKTYVEAAVFFPDAPDWEKRQAVE